MSKCERKVVRKFALETEKSIHSLCLTNRANKLLKKKFILHIQKQPASVWDRRRVHIINLFVGANRACCIASHAGNSQAPITPKSMFGSNHENVGDYVVEY